MLRTVGIKACAGLGGAAAAFVVSFVAYFAGLFLEQQWNTIVVRWELAPFAVLILAVIGGFVAGILGSFCRGVVLASLIGSVCVGSFLTWMSLRSGSPTGVVIWGSVVGFASGAAAGAVGQSHPRRFTQRNSNIAIGALIGVAVGAVLGSTTGNMVPWTASGAAVGFVIGLAFALDVRRSHWDHRDVDHSGDDERP